MKETGRPLAGEAPCPSLSPAEISVAIHSSAAWRGAGRIAPTPSLSCGGDTTHRQSGQGPGLPAPRCRVLSGRPSQAAPPPTLQSRGDLCYRSHLRAGTVSLEKAAPSGVSALEPRIGLVEVMLDTSNIY